MAISDDIKARVDIVDLVAQHVPDLRKAGRNFTARCPFHQENTPSFVVFPDRQTWRCFGACATGGDIFSFLMRMEGLDFPTSLKALAQRAGVPLPERRGPEGQRSPIHGANDAALRFFRDALVSERGSLARAYVDQRGIGEQAVARWGIGYAPSTGDDLLKRLTAMGFDEDLLVSAGLVARNEQGQARDMFRGRLMFALRDTGGQVVGFAGRSLDGSSPKYLNTPQTPVFDKGHLLYGMDRAKDAISREGTAVVVEGYTDVITAHEHGYHNVVASMGTALTEHQVALLKSRASRVVLALDADAAGQEAMRRSLYTSWQLFGSAVQTARRAQVLHRAGDLEVLRIAVLSQGKDPDELIKNDPALWRRLIGEAVPVVEFLFSTELQREQPDVLSLWRAVCELKSPAEQDRYTTRLADALGLSVPALVKEMDNQLRDARRSARRGSAARVETPAEAIARQANRDPLDEYALALAVRYPDLLERLGEIDPAHLKRPENRAVLSALLAAGIIEAAYAQMEGPLAEHLEQLTNRVFPEADREQRTADWEACLRRLEERYLRELKTQEGVALAQDSTAADGQGPAGYREAIQRQALVTNERLKQLFSSGVSTSR